MNYCAKHGEIGEACSQCWVGKGYAAALADVRRELEAIRADDPTPSQRNGASVLGHMLARLDALEKQNQQDRKA